MMASEDGPVQPSPAPTVHDIETRGRAGFVSGFFLGVLMGAGIALLFAPERGEKTRTRLRRRMRSLSEDARDGLDNASSRTREELQKRRKRLRAELEEIRKRAKARAQEARKSLE
jgi:gas vesicle protein